MDEEVNHLQEAKKYAEMASHTTTSTATLFEDVVKLAQSHALIALVERLDRLIEAVGKLPQAIDWSTAWQVKVLDPSPTTVDPRPWWPLPTTTPNEMEA